MRNWVFLAAVLLCLTACGSAPQPAIPEAPPVSVSETTEARMPASGTTEETVPILPQLMARAESPEAAETIARQYGITLVRYRNGLAAFYTDEDPADVMDRRQEGWPELYLNRISHAS